MKELLTLALVASILLGLAIPISNVTAQGTSYQVSGYVTNSNGQRIVGAEIIFSTQTSIPSVRTDSDGYYQVTVSPGTYKLTIWPPFDSNYLSYYESGISVSSNLIKNATLNTGCKLSGYLALFNNPVRGATVRLGSNTCGWYSNYTGYYFVVAPPGTYTLTVSPGTTSSATNFVTYQEYNFALTSNTIRNVTITNTTTVPPLTPSPYPTVKPSNTPFNPASNPTPTATPNNVGKFKISGYILDSTGRGIDHAKVLLNVPDIVPSLSTNAAGYYEMYAPAGTYHLNVWPPFNSSYIYYDQPGLVVTSNMVKDITLVNGYKVSGYVVDLSGKPATGVVVTLGNYFSGYYTTNNGYYVIGVPAGTYTMNAHPQSGILNSANINFPNYYEYNVVVNGNMVKNLIVGNPTVTSPPKPTNGFSPVKTPNPAVTYKMSGYVLDSNHQPIVGAKVYISGHSSTSAFTDSKGHYQLNYNADIYTIFVFPPFDGNYIMWKESGFSLMADSTKNFTMISGNKVSGVIYDPSGKPFMGGAAVIFGNFTPGYMSNSSGYYSLSLPNGIYTIQIVPTPSYNFSNYLESDFIVNNNMVKNVILSQKPVSSANTSSNIADIVSYQEELVSLINNLSAENANQTSPPSTAPLFEVTAGIFTAITLLLLILVARRKQKK